MTATNEIPTITARRITRPDGVTLLAFTCPECGRIATHGLPKGHAMPTHRLAHCPCYPRGYFINDSAGSKTRPERNTTAGETANKQEKTT